MSSPQRYLVRTHSVTWKLADKAVHEAISKLGENATNEEIILEAAKSFESPRHYDISTPIQLFDDKNNLKNYLNVVALIINVLLRIDLGPGAFPEWFDGARDFGRSETIVTPADNWFVFFFHAIVFFQGIFTFVQLLPNYRATSLVQDGVSYGFIFGTFLQLIGSILQSLENMTGLILSSACIAGMVASFLRILYIQSTEDVTKHSPEDYWLLRFPWSVQAGWFICVFLTSINSIFVTLEFGAVLQLTLAFVTLFLFALVAVKMLFLNGSRPNYVIPSVISIFCFGIYNGFGRVGMEDDFGGAVILLLHLTCLLVALGTVLVTAVTLYRKEFKITVAQSFPISEGGYEGEQMSSESGNVV
jgi:hypothetical protein